MVKAAVLLILFIVSFVQCNSLFKRSKIHDQFPDYSLRYKYPTICNTASKQVSGYFELPDGKNFFFWFVQSLSTPSKDPLILWLNGGPGCSSLLGLFMGVGPCSVDKTGDQLIQNPYSWTNNANVIYLDQPIQSGYSYHQNQSYSVSDSDTASEDVYVFLQLFLKEFAEFAHSELHIAGESYAGHFLPAFANTITEKNEQHRSQINLKSIMIGNGLTDPLTQYQHFKAMACEPSSYGTLIESPDKCKQLENDQHQCQKFIQKCYKSSTQQQLKEDCVMAASICNSFVVKPILDSTKAVNMYDIRRPCEDGPLCYDYFTLIKDYLNNSTVKSALGVDPNLSFELCSDHVNQDFQVSGDWMKPYVRDVTSILNKNISVLAYAGDADLICNWKGIRAWTLDVPWYGKKQYNTQKDIPLYLHNNNKTAVGEIKSSGPLTFIRLYNAGHMASYDQPIAVLDMLNRWILNHYTPL